MVQWSIVAVVVFGLNAVCDCMHCPDGWLFHENSCYYFSSDKEPWEVARMKCKGMCGYMTEIETQSENQFLTDEVHRHNAKFWIGASDLLVKDEWKWMTSHRDLTYSNWASGEPNNSYGNENCAAIRDDEWNDEQCYVSMQYICETYSIDDTNQPVPELIGR